MTATPDILDWSPEGHPRSRLYGDVYFSKEGGLAESRAVFLAGCGLPDGWAGQRGAYEVSQFVPLAVLIAANTSKLGVVATMSTSFYPPYLLARLVNSLDHTTEGRVGWNCVTGSNDAAAENYGSDAQRPHDERYDVVFTQGMKPEIIWFEREGAVLQRAAFSPNIKERADCSAALFTADGELLVQAEHIPVHLGSMPASVRTLVSK